MQKTTTDEKGEEEEYFSKHLLWFQFVYYLWSLSFGLVEVVQPLLEDIVPHKELDDRSSI